MPFGKFLTSPTDLCLINMLTQKYFWVKPGHSDNTDGKTFLLLQWHLWADKYQERRCCLHLTTPGSDNLPQGAVHHKLAWRYPWGSQTCYAKEESTYWLSMPALDSERLGQEGEMVKHTHCPAAFETSWTFELVYLDSCWIHAHVFTPPLLCTYVNFVALNSCKVIFCHFALSMHKIEE